jgi:ABC-type amino acid transport substrate-binding protein
LRPTFDGEAVVAALKPVLPHAPLTAAAVAARPAGTTVLDGVRAAQAVRVCYLGNRAPYAFTNRDGQLSGLDVEMAHQLAIDLQVSLQLVSSGIDTYADDLASGRCDIAMGGIVVTPSRSVTATLSDPYMEETLAFVVPDHLRDDYATWSKIRERNAVRIGYPNVPYFRRQVQSRLPAATLVPLDPSSDPFSGSWPFEAMMLSAERGAFLTLLHPEFSVVVPAPDQLRAPVAYAVPQRDEAWEAFVNAWLQLHMRDGALEALIDQWVYGKSFAPPEPRWSVVRNVLGWVR